MKEATGEVSMTVITIVVLALVLGIATFLFAGDNAPAKRWIEDTFKAKTGVTTNSGTSVDANISGGAVDSRTVQPKQPDKKTVVPKNYADK